MTRRIVIAFFVLAIVAMLPPFGRALSAVALILGIAARVPFTARGFWLLLGCPQSRYITWWLLPGLGDVSTEADSGATSADDEVLGLQHQENDIEPDVVSTAILLLSRHNLDARATAELLAVLQKPEGGYYLSANQICKVVGKNEALVKSWVRAMRPETQTPQAHGSQGRWERDERGQLVKVR